MFKVETYTNPLTFYNSLEVGTDALHVTSIPTLAMHIKERAALKGNHLKGNVIIYHHFYKALYPKWVSQKYKLDMKQVLRQIIRTQEAFQVKKEILLKQVDGLIETYRYWLTLGLVEMKSQGQDSEPEALKVMLYNQFKEHEEIKKGYGTLQTPLTPDYIDQCLQNVVHTQKIQVPEHHFRSIKKIYIYALNDLNPARFKFLKNLSDAGYEVIFRIPYDVHYPHVYTGWASLYGKVVPIEEWESIEVSQVNSSVLDFLEGKPNVVKQDRIVISHQYSEPTLFKNYLREHKLDCNRLELIACEDDVVNEVFRDEIDREKEVSHIFETPIGRFISHLYAIKDIEYKKTMTYEMYQEIISSGVINVSQTKGKIISGLEGISLLSDLKVYMEGVTSLEEIKERLYKLKQLYEVSEGFDELARSKVDRNHVKRYLQNPMRVFGFINPQGYDLTVNQLIMLTEELEKQINVLLGEKNPISSIEAHVVYLTEMIKESIAYKDRAAKLEKVYEEFLKRLGTFRHRVLEVEEMNEYLAILGKVGSSKHEAGELVLVKGIEHALGLCVNGVEELYLCDLSTTAMNHYIHRRQGRIELRSIEGLDKYIERLSDLELQASLQHMMTIGSMTRKHLQSFVKFNLMTLLTYYPGRLHLGWIKNMYPYDTEWYLLSIIRQIYTIETVEEEIEEIEEIDWFEEKNREEMEEVKFPEEQIEELIKQLSPFAWEDLQHCKKKFYYSNVLNHYPVYREDFTQRIAFGWIGKMFADQFEGKEQVTKQLFPLYPQWTHTLKQNLVDTTQSCSLGEYIGFDNIKFPKSMVSLWCLGKRKYVEPSTNKKQELLKKYLRKGNTSISAEEVGKRCYFCPHQIICQEGAFGVDREY